MEIALELMGVPGVGITISAVGVAIEALQHEKERKWGWLMFGR
jgi:hypothetical protein